MVLHKGASMTIRTGGWINEDNLVFLTRSESRRVYTGSEVDTCEVHRKSLVSGEWNIRILKVAALTVELYYMGLLKGLCQDVFPDLSPSERDFIMFGITEEESDHIYSQKERESLPTELREAQALDEILHPEDRDDSKCAHCGGPNH